MPTPVVERTGTPWITEAKKFLGTHEITGGENPTILQFWKDGKCTLKVTEDEVPWCSAFHSAMYERVGIVSARSGWAFDYQRWGEYLAAPIMGCTVVFRWGPNSGHIAWVVGRNHAGNLVCLGGNQSDEVNLTPFSPEHVVSYRWPKDWPHSPKV